MFWDHDYHFMGMHLVWWFVWLAFIISLLGWKPNLEKDRSKNSALDILQKRFASGQISSDEYKNIKSYLQKIQV